MYDDAIRDVPLGNNTGHEIRIREYDPRIPNTIINIPGSIPRISHEYLIPSHSNRDPIRARMCISVRAVELASTTRLEGAEIWRSRMRKARVRSGGLGRLMRDNQGCVVRSVRVGRGLPADSIRIQVGGAIHD